MARTLADSRAWMAQGTTLFANAMATMSDADYAKSSSLPGWTRGNVVAHVAANADAVGHLITWASTGVETPMYSSPEDRSEGIAKGVTLTPAELREWLTRSSDQLVQAMDRLSEDQWQYEVRTVQGRLVPTAETPWMRARETCIHSVDLGTGLSFADLPAGFVNALIEEICDKRGMTALPVEVAGAEASEVAAWLAGRPHTIADAPELSPWL